MVFLVVDKMVEEEVLIKLNELGFDSYTKLPKVIGKGVRAEPHFEDLVWPKSLSMYIFLVEDEKVSKDKLKELSDRYKNVGLRFFILENAELI